MVDLDVQRDGETNFLHWLETDFTLSSSLVLTPGSTNTSTGASYIGPSPPPGTPHRYVFWLFSQPSEFTIPESFSAIDPPTDILARIGFNLTEFVTAAGLDAPLAGAYFTVVNSSATASGTGASTPAQTSVVPFEGGSGILKSSTGAEIGFGILLAAIVATLCTV
jgi:Phosphatidylethanolamine-binding protein